MQLKEEIMEDSNIIYKFYKEFNDIISHISNNKDFLKLKRIKHHGITRYEHSLRVAYYSYKVTKLLHLDYKDTTEAAL